MADLLCMRRLVLTTSVAILAFALMASASFAASRRPVVTSFSPAEVPVNSVLTIKGKNFVSGASHDTVYVSNAATGKTVRVHPRRATRSTMTVVVPSTIIRFMAVDTNGQLQDTRFQLQVYARVLGSKTTKAHSPIVLPPGTTTTPTPGTGGGTTGTGMPPPPDCDKDGIPNSTDPDDDNDGLPDTTEAAIGTDPCKADTDGDGV